MVLMLCELEAHVLGWCAPALHAACACMCLYASVALPDAFVCSIWFHTVHTQLQLQLSKLASQPSQGLQLLLAWSST